MNTITGYRINEYSLIGNVKEDPSHYDLMNAVMICLGDDPENQDNNILKLLEVLLSNDAKALRSAKSAVGRLANSTESSTLFSTS